MNAEYSLGLCYDFNFTLKLIWTTTVHKSTFVKELNTPHHPQTIPSSFWPICGARPRWDQSHWDRLGSYPYAAWGSPWHPLISDAGNSWMFFCFQSIWPQASALSSLGSLCFARSLHMGIRCVCSVQRGSLRGRHTGCSASPVPPSLSAKKNAYVA